MRTSYILKGATLLLSTLCACTSELEPSLLVESGEINKITITMPDSPLDARTLISVGNTVTYAWASGDTIGIFPDKGYQVAFDMSSAEGDTYATFTGGGWALKGNSKYAAYYPFEYNNRQSSRIPITYEGQKQTGNKNTDKAGKFNYMVAKANTPDNGSVNFEMQRLGRFIILKFNVPEPTTLESVKLVATEDVFTLNGYVDLWAETPKIVSTEKSNSLSIKLEELTTTKENEEVTVYFFMEPVDLSGKKLSVEIKSEDGTLSFMEVDGKDMRANKAFALTAHQEGSYDNGVVRITKAGSMKELIGDDYLNIKTLKVIGPINGDDIYYLRTMLGAKDIDEAERGQLTTLDLSGATIRGGGRNPYVEYDSETGMSTGYPVNHNAISGRMFYQCLNLKNVILPNNINAILPNSFEGCEKLSSIVIPDGVTNISEYTFKNCTSLSSVSLPSVFYTIGVSAFEGCSSLVSITIPESITKIGGFAFCGCNALTSITIPNGVIDYYAFSTCKSLVSVQIGNGVTSIGNAAFSFCEKLASVKIMGYPLIDELAFQLAAITECYCYTYSPPMFSANSFSEGIENNAILYVPAEYRDHYTNSDWNNYFSIEAMQ